MFFCEKLWWISNSSYSYLSKSFKYSQFLSFSTEPSLFGKRVVWISIETFFISHKFFVVDSDFGWWIIMRIVYCTYVFVMYYNHWLLIMTIIIMYNDVNVSSIPFKPCHVNWFVLHFMFSSCHLRGSFHFVAYHVNTTNTWRNIIRNILIEMIMPRTLPFHPFNTLRSRFDILLIKKDESEISGFHLAASKHGRLEISYHRKYFHKLWMILLLVLTFGRQDYKIIFVFVLPSPWN